MRAIRQAGFTLVELMVALAMGLFLVAVMGTIYVGSKGTFLSQEAMARLQENGRFAMDTMGADLRMAGFRGCLGSGRSTGVVNTLNTPNASLYNFGLGVSASSYSADAWQPSVDAAISSLPHSPNPAGSVLTIRRPVGQGWALTAEMADPGAPLTVSAPAPFTNADLLMVTDCNGAAFFQATNPNPAATGSIEHIAGTALTPGMSSSSLGRAFLQDALVYRMATTTYYLAPSARVGRNGVMSLWAYTNPSYDGTVQPSELVTGVERMAVALGVDTNADLNADKYVVPSAVADWNTVVSVRIELLFVSLQDNVTTAPQPYVFGGTSVTASDRKLRTTMTLVASLRNSLP